MQIIMELMAALVLIGACWAAWQSELIIQNERLSKYKDTQ